MRVLLIKPPIRACRVEVGRHVPIGLAYLAATLRDAGHEVILFDALAHTAKNHIVPPGAYTATDRLKIDSHPRWKHLVHWGAGWDEIAEVIRASDPEVVGVSCMFTPYYETAYEVARLAKAVAPQARVLFGGQHPTVAHSHAIREKAFDVLVRGEAEYTVVDTVQALASGSPLVGIPGLVFRCGDGFCDCGDKTREIHLTPAAGQIPDLDGLPLPAMDLLDFPAYDTSTTLITSRGCPFSCTFCTVHATVGKAFRARSPELIVDEIRRYVEEYGVREFRIEDDNFTFSMDRVRALCQEIRQSGLDIDLHLPNGMTVVNLTADVVAEMASAGFRSLFLGLETTDPRHLRKIRKGFTSLDKVTAAASWFTAQGVDASASLIVGLLGHGLHHVAADAVSLAETGVPFGPNPFYPIPGSADYGRCLAEGLIHLDTELALFEGFNFAVGSDTLSPEEVYWAWTMTQGLSYWPRYVLEGAGGAGKDAGLSAALSRLVAHHTGLPPREAGFELLAAPAAARDDVIKVGPEGCFCQLQHVMERESGGGPVDFCMATGDILAGVIGMYCGAPMSAQQVSSTVSTPAIGCSFRIVREAVPAAAKVHASFAAALADSTAGRAAAQVGAAGRP